MLNKVILKFKSFIFPPLVLNGKEQLLYDVFKLLLSHKRTECITAPISEFYYVSNTDLQYYAKVWDEGITLTNHKFSFHHYTTNHRFQREIISMVRDFMEKDRAEFERTVFQNEVGMLKDIKESIAYSYPF